VSVEISILGPLEVRVDGETIALRGGKQRALLAVLALEAPQVVPTETLIDRVWGESAPAGAANAVQVYVSQLRKLLPADALVTQAPGYRLAVEPEQVDATRFERLVEAARGYVPGEGAGELREALALWRGEPLADVAYESFAQNEIRRLEELRVGALEDLYEAELAAGKAAELVPELEALVAEHPLRERMRRQLMLALYRSGRQADALEEYQRARTVLVDELGIDPSPELQELERAILTQDEGLAAAAGARRPQLPVPPTQLVGRDRELAEAVALLEREDVRLLTLTGPGGIGKTRLALELAYRFADRPGGAAFVQLAAVTDAAVVGSAIAQGLEISEAGIDVEAALGSGLRESPPLVVLDNFEQIVDAASVLSRLLATAPELKLVVTSRAVLRLAAEHEFPVPPLEAGDAVALFLQRAQAVRRDFAADESEIDELCAGIDRMPLAIELAAARVKLLTPGAMLERLGERLDLLAAGPRDAPARQQALRATIGWSYDLLDEPERQLFRRLGVFVGGCTLEAAEHVCADGGAVFEGLASLVDMSLLRLVGATGGSRFWMLRTIREYAVERLRESADETEIRERHLEHYVELARAGEEKLDGPDAAVWAERLELEHANLRAAIAFALDSGDGGSALALCTPLVRFWEYHGHLYEDRRRVEPAPAPAPEAPLVLRAKAWNGAAILAAEQGDFESAQRLFETALEVARESGDPKRISSTITNLGNIALYRRDYERARELYEEGEKAATAAGIARPASLARENLGLVMVGLGDRDAAVQIFEETLGAAREAHATHDVSTRQRLLARALIERGELDRPRELLAESLELTRTLREPRGLAECLEVAGALAVAGGDAAGGAQLFGAADAVRRSIGGLRAPDQQPWYERTVEDARARLGDTFDAEWAQGAALPLDDALALAERVGEPV
jgi:predicted ATPase/DNA-binding SARP family transcriptional activator